MIALLVASLLASALALLVWGRGSSRAVPASLLSPPPGRERSTIAWSLTGRRRRGRAAERAATEMLDLLDALAPALRAGLPPVAALRLVTRAGATSGSRSVTTWPSGTGAVDELADAAAQGGPLAPTWSAYADALSSSDLRLVAAAWSLCDALGSPLAPTVATVADVVRRRRAVRHRIAAASAGPRATMRVLTALPLTGPLVALAVGVSPGDLYAEPAGAGSLVVGLVLLLLGRLWAGRLVLAVAAEPRRASRWRSR